MKRLAAVLAIAAIAGTANADLFFYDFGTGASSHTANAASLTFLPQPGTGGGEDRVRVGSGAGGFYMENPGDAGVGSGTELRMVAPTATSVNKLSIYDYTAGKTFSLGMTLKMTGGASGTFSLFVGDGTTYSDSTSFSGAQVFTGMRLAYGASDAVTTSYRIGSGWTSASVTPFAQNNVYQIEIYGNNTTGALDYEKGGTQTLNANEWDLWINGALWDEGIGKALLPADANIDSFMIYGESSVGNVANLIIDDISYSNGLTVIPEPATFGLIAGPGLGILLACLRRRREESAAATKA